MMNIENKLKFSEGNAKLGKTIFTFSLPAGWSCPGSNDCQCKADRTTGKVTDGPNVKFRCFSASQECVYPNVRLQRWHNFNLLSEAKTAQKMADLILASIPEKANIIRVHVSGDFFCQEYFNAWMMVATARPDMIFYAYTKSINFWTDCLTNNVIPSNFKLNASLGGLFDHLVISYNLKYVKVVFTIDEAGNLPIDHDDTHAYKQDGNFALLLHGTQPKKSPASVALQILRNAGIGGYGKQKDGRHFVHIQFRNKISHKR